MKAVIQPLAWGIAMASMLALASGVALDLVVGTTQAAVIQHEHHGHATSALVVEGQQWATDAALRDGMTRLRDAAASALPSDPAQPISERQAMQLQAAVEAHVSFLVANCDLPEQADAALHGLLAELLNGAKALAEPAEREQGARHILAALQRYPEIFAAPLWNDAAGDHH